MKKAIFALFLVSFLVLSPITGCAKATNAPTKEIPFGGFRFEEIPVGELSEEEKTQIKTAVTTAVTKAIEDEEGTEIPPQIGYINADYSGIVKQINFTFSPIEDYSEVTDTTVVVEFETNFTLTIENLQSKELSEEKTRQRRLVSLTRSGQDDTPWVVDEVHPPHLYVDVETAPNDPTT